MDPSSTSPAAARPTTVAYGATCLLLAAAPFERLRPLIAFPGQNLTTVEVCIVTGVMAWLASTAMARQAFDWRTPLTWPWLTWLGVSAIAAVAAPAFHASSIKVVGRLAIGLIAVLLVANGITTPRRLTVAIWVAVMTAAIVAFFAIFEYAGVPLVRSWLNAFHDGLWVVGGQVRASGTLEYPTIASMYFEIAFALSLGAFLSAFDEHAGLLKAALFVATLVIAEGVVVTLTRAGLVTMAVSLAVVGASRFRRRGFDGGLWSLMALAAATCLFVVLSASPETIRLRFTTEGQQGWYRAAFLVEPKLSFAPASLNVVEATVINVGRVTWEPRADPPFHVSYHWLDDETNHVVRYDGLRTPLPRAVAPGDSVRMRIQVRAPEEAGRYRLGWDVVQEGRLWFSTEPGSRMALSSVMVSGPRAADDELASSMPSPVNLPPQAVRPGRRTLWMAALRVVREHPIFGIGPDNFRLSYGPYAGIEHADPRVHSNSMYLEVLAGAGMVGLAAFLWLCWRAQATIRRELARMTSSMSSLYPGIVAAVLAIALHGFLDSFLTFTPTYLLISLTLGLAVAPAAWTEAV